MKKLLLILSVVVCANFAEAQTIRVIEDTALFSTGTHNALITTVYQNSKDDVIAKWKDYLKDFKNEKVKFDKNEMFADNVLIKEWGNNTVDIYTRFEEDKQANTVKVIVGFDLGGAYLTSQRDSSKYVYAEKLLRDFAVQTTRIPYEAKLKAAQKVLDDMVSDQASLEKDIKNLHGDIDNYRDKISKAEDDIKKTEEKKEKKESQVVAQKSVIIQIKSDADAVK